MYVKLNMKPSNWRITWFFSDTPRTRSRRYTQIKGEKTGGGKKVWTRDSITAMLRSERNCGDVLTRKTYTPSYLDHKAKRRTVEKDLRANI